MYTRLGSHSHAYTDRCRERPAVADGEAGYLPRQPVREGLRPEEKQVATEDQGLGR